MTGDSAEPVTAQFARNLIRFRGDAAITQDELAARAGLNRSHIAVMEKGRRTPRLDTLIRLAGGLGVDPEELLDGITWHPTEIRVGEFHGEDDPSET